MSYRHVSAELRKAEAEVERLKAKNERLRACLKCSHDSETMGSSWNSVEQDGKCWWRCKVCGLMELWEGGMLHDIALAAEEPEK